MPFWLLPCLSSHCSSAFLPIDVILAPAVPFLPLLLGLLTAGEFPKTALILRLLPQKGVGAAMRKHQVNQLGLLTTS